jgi:hypothetical protein
VTAPTVVAGLGYPADRKETSPEPTGWNVGLENVSNVSRETFATLLVQDSDSAAKDRARSSRETSKVDSETFTQIADKK